MKQKLHFLFFITPFLVFTQSPINQFVNNIETEYAIVSSSTPLDESATGAGLTWNFTNLTQVGTNTDTNAAPTGTELLAYPNTTEVLTITTTGAPPIVNKLFIRDNANEISLTGASQDGNLTLEFSDNATLGNFPLSYNFSNTDVTSGNFSGVFDGDNVGGTFWGTLNTDVDAHGTLNLNDFGLGVYSGNVTRLKTELEISLTTIVFNIGTITQTNYYYYDNTNNRMVFRSSKNVLDLNVVGNIVNETTIQYEALDQSLLSNEDFTFGAKKLKLYPNPVGHRLNFRLDDSIQIERIQVYDLNGREFNFINNTDSTIDVSGLSSGLYFLKLYTDSGILSQKFFKK